MISFSLTGSDKRIFMLPIRCDKPTPTEAGAFEAMFNCLRVDKPLTIASVGKNYIAIYGGNTQQDGASLVLYNTHYHVVKCTHPFKVHLDNCRLWVIGKRILMAVGKELTCWPFHISQEKLSDIIGSKRSIELSGTVKKDCINEESEMEEYVVFKQEAQPETQLNSESRKQHYLKQTARSEIDEPTEIFENFNRNLKTLFSHDIPIDVVHDHSLLDLKKTITLAHPQDQLYSSAVITILAEKLENCGSSESEITERIIPLLIKEKLTNELSICLRKYTNISEQVLAKSLKFFVCLNESDEKTTLINQIFTCSFNKDLIKKHLRMNLSLDNAIYLLELIHRDLIADEILLDEPPQYGHDFDSDTALINWFIVILDAHYTQFLLARDSSVNDKILKWKALIESFVSGVRELKSVASRLHNLVHGKAKQNDNTSSKYYSVEKIKLY